MRIDPRRPLREFWAVLKPSVSIRRGSGEAGVALARGGPIGKKFEGSETIYCPQGMGVAISEKLSIESAPAVYRLSTIERTLLITPQSHDSALNPRIDTLVEGPADQNSSANNNSVSRSTRPESTAVSVQRLSLSCRIARTAARTRCRRRGKAGKSYIVPVAETLSRPLPDADRRVIS